MYIEDLRSSRPFTSASVSHFGKSAQEGARPWARAISINGIGDVAPPIDVVYWQVGETKQVRTLRALHGAKKKALSRLTA